MSIVRMRKVFRSRTKLKIGKKIHSLPSPAEAIFYLIILIFVAGAYYTFGGPKNSGGDSNPQQNAEVHVAPIVALVNGEKIPQKMFEANLQMRQGADEREDITQARYLRSGTLTGLIDAILMRQAAKKENIRVTGAEIEAEKTKQVDQLVSQRFPEKRSLVRFLKKGNKSLAQYKTELRKELFKSTEGLREQVSRDKLQKAVEAKVTMTDAELAESYTEVQASHILIDPKQDATPAEEPAKKAGQPAAQPPAKVDGDALAKAKADKLLAEIKAGGDFAKLATANSADPGSAAKGGDLGWFKQSMMVKEFSDVAFKLKPGEVSEVVKSDFGYHIIKVMGRRQNLPKDFDKSKQTYRDQALQEKKSRAWSEYQKQLTKDAKIEVKDPELAAYRLMDDGKEAEGVPFLEQAVKDSPGNAVAAWELAQIYDKAKKTADAVALLEKVVLTEDGARNPQVRMKLADLYSQQNNKPKALEQYQAAFDNAVEYTMQNFMINMQVEQKLKELGDTTRLPEVSKWLADYREEQKKNPTGGMGGMGGFGGPMGNFQVP